VSVPTVSLQRYSAVAIVLHWTIAVLIFVNIGLAWYFDDLTGTERLNVLQFHKPIGITVLVLTLARIAWRFVRPPPPMPPMAAWERFAAHAVHGLLYVIMLGMPLTGWAMVSASKLINAFPISFYLFNWPAIEPLTNLPRAQMHQVHRVMELSHTLLAYGAYGLITLHVGAALMHQFVHRDAVLGRMLPFVKARAA
jgi:cytochrome b561